MKKIIIFILLGLIGTGLLATDVIRRDRATLRQGPGSMFPILAELQKGAEIEINSEKSGWLDVQVTADTLTGYLSAKAITERKTQDDIFAAMGNQEASLEVSRHGMSAGVKGFADKFTEKFDGNPAFFDLYASYRLDPEKYRIFRKQTYKKGKTFTKSIQIPVSNTRDYFYFSEEGMGIGIASRIAALGIYQNDYLTEYINQVGNLIVEVSDVYDIEFKFFILDSEKANAYACPGGIIFITKGMLRQIRTEAELACILAHEIGHVARKHGMLELEERKHHVKADDAFAELDMEMEFFGIEQDSETREVEDEMEDLAFDIFETLFAGRLAEYEEEADFLAIIYSARAGYDANQILNILNRLLDSNSESTNEHYTTSQIETRIEDIQKNLKRLVLSKKLFDHRLRWTEMTFYLK
ncbi:MAG: M48 family metalloprotease [Candidatus Cloacimonetes bacterium]|nr:M48 family metalloprotease [Candidatus Cloacimonadota bacterium]